MSVKSFKFVSPGVFINEIDNSFIPRSADAIGPVVVGRSTRGPAMQPVKVESYSQFVEMFGDTVPGGAGGDISRDGNFQSPMYGTYAAKAFLVSNVAPLTYIRLLGEDSDNATTAGTAGWETTNDPAAALADNGGAYGLFLFASAAYAATTEYSGGAYIGDGAGAAQLTGTLAAIWYLDSGSAIALSGTLWGPTGSATTSAIGHVIEGAGSNKDLFTVQITGTSIDKKIQFSFDDSKETFIRKRFNTNPQLASESGKFYAAASFENYWLGETYEQEVRDDSLVGANSLAVILPLAASSSAGTGPANKRVSHQEGRSGWFIGQDLDGDASAYSAESAPKLFRLRGRGHGEWLHKNLKVSIEKIRASQTTTTDYGTFSVVLRSLNDTDNKVQVLERFDNLNLDPGSPNFIGRRIGDRYQEWNESERRVKTYGDYANSSKYVYVELESDIEIGSANPLLLPFGYYGPPKYKDVNMLNDAARTSDPTDMIHWRNDGLYNGAFNLLQVESSTDWGPSGALGQLKFPVARLRHSSSDGGIADQTNSYFGFQNTRTSTSTRADLSMGDVHSILDARLLDSTDLDMSGSINGVAAAYIFTMNDVVQGDGGYYYKSGSYNDGDAASIASGGTYKTLLQAGYDRFTAPFFGGFDGWDVKLPDPLYNAGMTSATERNSSPFYTIKRAIDTISDPESVNMNLLNVAGITNETLTNHAIDICEDRGDAMALIDLPNLYYPQHEAYKSSKKERVGVGVNSAVTSLKDRRIDSSYGATFYPWVQTRDQATGRGLWIPPSVAMMGVLASSQAASHLWFAPAGFNRGGLSDGAAGIPVMNVTERLTSKERDKLYEANINPIASFPSSGIVVFGQKTLQERQSALDRINVRRLVIYLKKQISILSTEVLFEQNVQSTWNRFKSLVEPFLANVKVQFGITDYRLILDETTTTPDLIDQNIMYAKIMVKPARAIEYIAIDFVVASTGASFDD